MQRKIIVSEDLQMLSRNAAELFVEIGNRAISEKNLFTVALSGGSTPKILFQTLASADFRDRLDWTRIIFFFGDERFVAPDSPESNYRMARENLFEPLNIGAQNVRRWQTELSPGKAAADYENELSKVFAARDAEIPRFDLILLGVGADGHTASLFPETAALKEAEKIAVANWVEKLAAFRLTFTFPLINNAANVVFLASGAEKAEILKTILEGEFAPDKFPSQSVKPHAGELFWLIDRAAAKRLSGN